jgi:hypothetical protein
MQSSEYTKRLNDDLKKFTLECVKNMIAKAEAIEAQYASGIKSARVLATAKAIRAEASRLAMKVGAQA